MSIPARRPLRTQGRVTSKDGTSIAYESIGAGPGIILLSGGLDDGSENEPLARELADGFSVSSGGALVLEAALAGVDAAKLAVYEIPYDTSEGTDLQQRQYVDRLTALLADGRRDDALELFMRVAGSPEEQIASRNGENQ